jgi:Protein of unknown function (DUF3175)
MHVMSMLTIYINRAGSNLSDSRLRVLELTKNELRKASRLISFAPRRNLFAPASTFSIFGVVAGPPAAHNPHPECSLEEGRIAADAALLI